MARGKKRERVRVPKEARKNLRLWAEGARETILTPHIDGYSIALSQGWRQERAYWKSICREYHARVDWRVLDHDEPVLADWNPGMLVLPETLDPEEAELKRKRVKTLNAVSHICDYVTHPAHCDQRIRRWFTYRIRRIRKHRLSAGLDPTKDPYAVLLAKLSGQTAPPKARQAFQQYMHDNKETIEAAVAEEWAAEKLANSAIAERTKAPKVGFRAGVARDLFLQLPEAEQKALGVLAKTEAHEAKAKYQAALNAPPSETPEARQK